MKMHAVTPLDEATRQANQSRRPRWSSRQEVIPTLRRETGRVDAHMAPRAIMGGRLKSPGLEPVTFFQGQTAARMRKM